MSDIAEGIGGMVEGALTGRAVEPDRGETKGKDGDQHGGAECSNCGAVVAGTYCPDCGQKLHVHRTLSAIFHDLIHGVLHLDGKFWLTLPLLVFKPGRLTRRYVEGERAKFVSPMAMFLFSVFAMFAVFQMVGLSTPTSLNLDETAQLVREEGNAEIARLRAELEAMPASDPEREQRQIDLELLESIAASDALGEGNDLNFTMEPTGIAWLDDGIAAKWRENPTLMLYKLQANGYKFSWLLIPLSLPTLWLLFIWRRQFKAYDHAVFVTYSLSFMSLLFIALSLANKAGLAAGWVFAIFAVAAPLHIYKHLKYAYNLSRFSVLWRFPGLLFSIVFTLMLFLQVLLLLGAF